MTRMILPNLIDQLRTAWISWWDDCFPSAIPLPVIHEIPGRDALFVKLEEHRKSHAIASAARHEAIQTITKDLYSAQQLVDRLQEKLTAQHRADWLENLQTSIETEHLTAMIIQKAPLSLGLFVEEIDHELNCLRRMEPTIIHNGSDRNFALMTKTVRFRSDAGSIKKRVLALLAARERTIAMQSQNMPTKEIISELYRLRKSLPEIAHEETRGAISAAVLGH